MYMYVCIVVVVVVVVKVPLEMKVLTQRNPYFCERFIKRPCSTGNEASGQ